MIFHDLECQECGLRENGHGFESSSVVKFRQFCPTCGFFAYNIVYESGFQFDFTNPNLYGPTRFYPGAGKALMSYGEKRQFLRESGQVEAGDLLGGSRDWDLPEGYNGPNQEHNFTARESVNHDEGWNLGEALQTPNSSESKNTIQKAAEKAMADAYKS
tara:strand:+ start:804 stop:1280 length:477 start_codon:yes stop_codon:yes gene_type:complete